MVFRFASLGSGSEGNGLLVAHDATLILIDCGFSAAEATRRLQRLGVTWDNLSAILVTHEHSDHIGGVLALQRKTRCPVFGSFGTLAAIQEELGAHGQIIRDGISFTVGSLTIHPYAVPHDSREPLQFVIEQSGRRLGILTDTGSITPHIEENLKFCQALFIEANYDPDLLDRGPYPPALKARVKGAYGHLSNQACAELIQALDHNDLRHIIAAHLSRKNNTPEQALAAILGVLRHDDTRLRIANQAEGFDWITLSK